MAAKTLMPVIVHSKAIRSRKGGLSVGRLLIQLGNRSVNLAIGLCDRQVERVVLPEMELQQEPMIIG